jgi:tight adherence protein C
MVTSDTDRRAEVINLLQEAVNSLATTVESGFGFDHAMYQYSQETDNELSRAFTQVLEAIRSGVQRRTALRDMAERIDVVEVTGFVEAIVQAEEEGTSILEMLEDQVEQMGGGRG